MGFLVSLCTVEHGVMGRKGFACFGHVHFFQAKYAYLLSKAPIATGFLDISLIR